MKVQVVINVKSDLRTSYYFDIVDYVIEKGGVLRLNMPTRPDGIQPRMLFSPDAWQKLVEVYDT